MKSVVTSQWGSLMTYPGPLLLLLLLLLLSHIYDIYPETPADRQTSARKFGTNEEILEIWARTFLVNIEQFVHWAILGGNFPPSPNSIIPSEYYIVSTIFGNRCLFREAQPLGNLYLYGIM